MKCGFKLTTSLLLATTIIIGTVNNHAFAKNTFSDIINSNAYNAIENLNKNDSFNNFIGESDTEYLPNKTISRIEFIIITLNSSGYKGKSVSEFPPFKDIAEVGEVYKEYLSEAYMNKILSGREYSGELYADYAKEITREEALTFLARLLNYESEDPISFTDEAEVSKWAYKYISGLNKNNFFNGIYKSNLEPKATLTRGEAAILIDKALDSSMQSKQKIEIFSGTTSIGFLNSDVTNSKFTVPKGIIDLPNGDILISDSDSNLIRKISGDKVETIAGKVVGTGFSGVPLGGYVDNVKAKEAVLNLPQYLAVSSNGDIYFTERENNTVRVIKKYNDMVYKISGNQEAGYKNGNSTETLFNKPSGIAVDKAGNIYVSDTLNNCIRIIDSKGNSQLFAGKPKAKGGFINGTIENAEFNEPMDLFLDSKGDLYIADSGNSMIRKISDGKVTTVAGSLTELTEETDTRVGGFKDGSVLVAQFKSPKGIYVVNDTVYVADTGNNRIRKIESGMVTTVAGNGKPSNKQGFSALDSSLNAPFDVIYLNNKLYFTDSLNNCIKVVSDK